MKAKGKYLLQKFHGKGGWTYAEIPEIAQNPKNPFGWVTVSGSIDNIKLKHVKLMPMGNGQLFFPVKGALRKSLKKEAGDFVQIEIEVDNSPIEVPKEILECFGQEPKLVMDNFLKLKEGEKKTWIDYIYSAKTEDTKADRILKWIKELEN